MHGLINRSIQSFVVDTYGSDIWRDVLEAAAPGTNGFESMLTYDDAVTIATLDCLTRRLGSPVETVLEDLGTYLVAHPNNESLRRLLRFGGISFEEFLHSLEDLPDRARLAVSDLELPQLEVRSKDDGSFLILSTGRLPGFGQVLLGLLRGMADDYGVLVMLDHTVGPNGEEIITINVLDNRFAKGRSFELSAGAT